jgi:TonB family protein
MFSKRVPVVMVCLAVALLAFRVEAQQQGRLVSTSPTVYPLAAKAAGIEGKVKLKGTIGTDGKVRNVTVVAGPDELREAAVNTFSHWVYQPYIHHGAPVEVDTTVTVNFSMGDKNKKAAAQAAAQEELAKQQTKGETGPAPPNNH